MRVVRMRTGPKATLPNLPLACIVLHMVPAT